MKHHLAGSFRHSEIVALSWLTWQICQPVAQANPSSGSAAPNTASFSTLGKVLTVTTSGNAYINWSSFNIDAGETTTFVQPSATSVVWNHITDANASQIMGTINANGYVVLQNQNGFSIGGSASINAHGLIITTAPLPVPDLSGGGAWNFSALPPKASIVNLGQINIAGGGSAFLIASDIENNGMISAPQGKIGLYAGEQVLVSLSPDGRALSAQVTLPAGSVDNNGRLIADGGTIAAQAQTVNQNGLIQADSVQSVNGVIELVAGDQLALGATSVISATGDPTATEVSAGGSVSLKAGNTFADNAGSAINVSGGTQGGNGGQVEITAPLISPIKSSLNSSAVVGYNGGELTIHPTDITLDGTYATMLNTLINGGLSQLSLQADDDIEVSSLWTLPKGSAVAGLNLTAANQVTLDSGSGISLPAGNIGIHASTINQNGTIQANSVQNANGTIELVAGNSLTLGASSTLSAAGDPTSSQPSPGGFVVLKSGNIFADTAGSTLSVAGQGGGQAGIIDIIGAGVSAGTLQSALGSFYALLINPYDLTISADSTDTSTGNPILNVYALANYSQINLHVRDNIEIVAPLSLNDQTAASRLSLTAGNKITIDDAASITAGADVSVNLTAGTGLAAGVKPASGSDGIYLNSDPSQPSSSAAFIQTQNGDINLWAANEVQIAPSDNAGNKADEVGFSGITTQNGGNITVQTAYGDVNTGNNPVGYIYQATTPYYSVATGYGTSLGGISTAAGGNVTINAGGNVTSFLPYAVDSGLTQVEGGTGAYGPEPGNVTITAGGSIYGHYVLANGVGSLSAGQDVGNAGKLVALSLVNGGWTVNAPNGNIYLQEVRNPNGDFNNLPSKNNQFIFDYAADASVDLMAGDGVYLTGSPANLPRLSGFNVPVIYPPELIIAAGAGGVDIENNVTLFPSADQGLAITTTDKGNLRGPQDPSNPTAVLDNLDELLFTPVELLMSDSSATHWVSGNPTVFNSNGSGTPLLINNPDPVVLNISGNMEDLDLVTSKQTQINVGGDMINCGFSGQNLHASDVSAITVGGQIFNSSAYSFATLSSGINSLPSSDLPPGLANTWDAIFSVGLDPNSANLVPISTTVAAGATGSELSKLQTTLNSTVVLGLVLPSTLSPAQWANYVLGQANLFQLTQANGKLVGTDQNLIYTVVTDSANNNSYHLTYSGQMLQSLVTALTQPVTVLRFGANGLPVTYAEGGVTYFATDQVSWVPAAETPLIQALYTASLLAPPSGVTQIGYTIGGPGQFNLSAQSISLGSSYGIISSGVDPVYDGIAGADRYQNLGAETPVGATVNIMVSGDLNMLSSTIASTDGGDVNVTSTGGTIDLGSGATVPNSGLAYGIFTSGKSDVNVIADLDVDINSSRIAAFAGGNIFIESLTKDVNVGSGGDTAINIYSTFYNPVTKKGDRYLEDVYGSGIVANTLLPAGPGVSFPANSAALPGNITVKTPQGNITATLGGITQEALDGNIDGGPTITLAAGTFPTGTPGTPDYSAGYPGEINLGESGGVIGGTVNVSANGDVIGNFFSHQNSNINSARNFNGLDFAGGTASVSSGGSVSGVIVGISAANVSGDGGTADVLSQNVSKNGSSSESTLGTSATATTASQSAANQSDNQAKQQLAANVGDSDDELKKKKKQPLIQHIKRVTVLLPGKT